ncbi:MAG TPA: hypothetical protein VFR42_00400 [Candidatus Acidoferrum sp.]|nr:hypothetical protein [Candidatus Acidoferrum sp.]
MEGSRNAATLFGLNGCFLPGFLLVGGPGGSYHLFWIEAHGSLAGEQGDGHEAPRAPVTTTASRWTHTQHTQEVAFEEIART